MKKLLLLSAVLVSGLTMADGMPTHYVSGVGTFPVNYRVKYSMGVERHNVGYFNCRAGATKRSFLKSDAMKYPTESARSFCSPWVRI